MVDYYSRYYEVKVLKSTTTQQVIDHLEDIFHTYRLPRALKSNNGSQFARFCEENGPTHHKLTARWPAANGEVERQNASLLK